MALNLSTLTSPATSGDVLAEALTTADFLEPVPVLRNLARSSNRGSDAKQDVALNQPKALPLIKNPAGDLGGYLYIPNVAGNYATGPSVTIGSNETWEAEVEMVITQFNNYIVPFGGGDWTAGFGLLMYGTGYIRTFSKSSLSASNPSGITLGTPVNIKYGFDGTDLYVDVDDNRVSSATANSQSASITHSLELNQQSGLSNQGNYAIQKAKLTVNNAVVFDCDFNGSTSIRHGDTKFQASVGGPVTLTRAGNDPVTVVKKSVLRFDGADDFMDGVFNQTITDGYMFAAFSVLGDGGESYGHIFDVTSTGQDSGGSGSFTVFRNATNDDFRLKYNNNSSVVTHQDVFDSSVGDIMLEGRMEDGSQITKINNADEDNGTTTFSGALNAEEFVISADNLNGANTAIDLEYLALFPADSVPDEATASKIRNYINNRNNVFDLKDGFGYYFFDAQKAPVGNISSGSASWNGRIIGSDNGDTDKLATQATANDQPVGDGYVVTFADTTDHLDIPSTTQAGWQVVGTSLGTFVYRVNANAVTELNLLGNLGSASFRKAGDLYGIILLPESATGADIEEARKLLIDRGAADGVTGSSLYTFWYGRGDIVEFRSVDTASVTSFYAAWRDCNSLTSFPLIDTSSGTNFTNAWRDCNSLTSFPLIDTSSGTSFYAAWFNCTSLTSFPLIDTSSGTNFYQTWYNCNSLTSFPLIDTSSGTNFYQTWYNCNSLTSFPLIDTSSGTSFSNAWRNCNSLTSFPLIDTSSGTNFGYAWRSCTSLTSFPLIDTSSGTSFFQTWRNCTSLTSFPAGFFDSWNPSSISNAVFNLAWDGCTSLTAQSVENILVPIDSSGKHATSTGASGGTALADAGIDIDYDGSGLTAATTAAITSLKSKGWSIFINSVEQ